MTWWSGRALGLDFETDGPVPTEARVITGALVHMPGPGHLPQPMELMLQPERDIPQEAIDVHGITTERAREEGVLREMGIAQIAATIAELAGPEVPVVGHNVGSYDLTLLDREMRRLGLGRLEIERGTFSCIDQVRLVLGVRVEAIFPVIDTLVLDKAADRYRKGSRRLVDAAKHYGVPMAEGSAHGATADVIASLRIAIAIANSGAFADKSLADLHCAQVKWKAQQADGLRSYFLAKGNESAAATVSGDWPVRAVSENEAAETADTAI